MLYTAKKKNLIMKIPEIILKQKYYFSKEIGRRNLIINVLFKCKGLLLLFFLLICLNKSHFK